MPNRLANEASPYLLQHVDNPVDWFPWGEEAFAEARRRNVPVFLSVGYSSCHWCHVMAHESFEDDATAALMNERFVNVKVDREERPDVDAVYMRAVQAMTGHGGWPMSVFLTPGGAPFFAGTYWPRTPRHGMASFEQVLLAVSEAWHERPDEVLGSASSIAAQLDQLGAHEPAGEVELGVADEAAALVLERAWDRTHGGFGRAPKFPQAMTIEWLLARHARTGEAAPRDAAVQALTAMARGGIHDQLAGGFARYSTDARWLVPHFEKMLYDNALLVAAYAIAATVTGHAELERVARTTAGFLLGELTTADGTFVSAIDADSEGEEGRFSVWGYGELVEVITSTGADPAVWTRFLGATSAGNWEGTNVLSVAVPLERLAADRGVDPAELEVEWERVRLALLRHRAGRVPPGVDDKALTDWNALTVRGLVRAGLLLEEPGWVEAGRRAAEHLHQRHVVDGRLLHTSRGGEVAVPAFLADHALLALADLELLQATADPVWLVRAEALARAVDERFRDPQGGGWFQTADDAERLVSRPKDTWDDATPSGTSVMVEVCLALAGLTGDLAWRDRALEGIRAVQEDARRAPTGHGWLLRQLEALAADPRDVAIVGAAGPRRDALARTARRAGLPGTTVLVADPGHGDALPVLAGRGEVEGLPAAYVCRALACERPVTDPDELAALLSA